MIEYDREERDDRRQPILKHMEDTWIWHEVRPKVPYLERDHGLIKNKDLRLEYSQRQIESLLTAYYHFGVDVSPEYQREYVWTEDDKVKLIDSIFNQVDIGKFVFISKPSCDGPWLEILDGKQRLKAITDFYENRFKYNGLYFNSLSGAEKSYFERFVISYAEVRDCPDEMKFRLFLLLNTRGVSVEEAHLDEIKRVYSERFGREID